MKRMFWVLLGVVWVVAGCGRGSGDQVVVVLQQGIRKAVEGSRGAVVSLMVRHDPCHCRGECTCPRAVGSGVHVGDGYIVTTEGLLHDAMGVTVSLQDGAQVPGQIVGKDFETNLGLVRAERTDFPAIPWGNSDHVHRGDLGILVGNTYYSLGVAASMGMLGRTWIGGDDGYDEPLLVLHTALNQGQSGAPVLTINGEWVGLADGKIQDNDNVCTIIPVNTIRKVFPLLKEKGGIARGWLGIKSEFLCEDERLRGKVEEWKDKGIVVLEVIPDGPAARAGLRIGDVIVEMEDHEISNLADLRPRVTTMLKGKTVELQIHRDGEEMKIRVTLGDLRPEEDRMRRCGSRSV
ncbi:serine protease [candidate division KSB1 bacterium]|nr:serine protease [candidate division KSB1 bacterium]